MTCTSDWICGTCGELNYYYSRECFNCSAEDERYVHALQAHHKLVEVPDGSDHERALLEIPRTWEAGRV